MSSELVAVMVGKFKQLKARVDFLLDDLEAKDREVNNLLNEAEAMTKARWLITETQKATQERFKQRVEDLVTMAIRSVFEDRDFGFELVFETERNQMQVRPVVWEMVDGVKEVYEDIENDLGGGIVDVISFALRIIMWSLEKPRSRNVIVLDEPMKNMGDLIALGGEMFREVAHRLGFQLIIVTHDPELIDIADRAFHVKHVGDKSVVKTIEGKNDAQRSF